MRTFEDWFDEHAIMWGLSCDTRMISWAEEVWAAAIEEAQNCLTAAGHSEAAGLLFSGEEEEPQGGLVMKLCVNGDGRSVCPPSKVICKECIDAITAKLEAMIRRIESDPTDSGMAGERGYEGDV